MPTFMSREIGAVYKINFLRNAVKSVLKSRKLIDCVAMTLSVKYGNISPQHELAILNFKKNDIVKKRMDITFSF